LFTAETQRTRRGKEKARMEGEGTEVMQAPLPPLPSSIFHSSILVFSLPLGVLRVSAVTHFHKTKTPRRSGRALVTYDLRVTLEDRPLPEVSGGNNSGGDRDPVLHGEGNHSVRLRAVKSAAAGVYEPPGAHFFSFTTTTPRMRGCKSSP
jgi:hypothetical protein